MYLLASKYTILVDTELCHESRKYNIMQRLQEFGSVSIATLPEIEA